ncbi:MAG: Do family serine endopeptidase [Spirochaetaceae bacterium]|jgi:Do/DeqQ family serine protease|nr:Do family serine endopeptidase [Spirochaetaceae bacterium]
MTSFTRRFLGIGVISVLCIALLSFSCSSEPGTSKTAYADSAPVVSIPADALAVTEALQNSFRAISDGVLPSVVEVDVVETKTVTTSNPFDMFPFFFFGNPRRNGEEDTQEYRQEGLGSGVIVRRTGNTLYVLTNQHVVGTADEISIKLNDGRTFTGKLVGTDERKDIALVSFESNDMGIPVAVLGDSTTVHTGDICFAMGAPLGFYASVSMGIISATGRSGGSINNISDFIQTDAAINQGNSGGPLVNIYGEVIGINTWIASQSGGSVGLGFSIPINNVKNSIDSFISSGKVNYGWIGVALNDADGDYKKAIGAEGKTGALVLQIYLDSPAAKGGMEPGDYIIALNGKPVRSQDQLVLEVGDLQAGAKADFTVIRNGKQLDLTIQIAERNEASTADNSKLWPGFMPMQITDDIRKQLSLDSKITGIIAAGIQPKSPAAVMGVQAGDIITKVNDAPVSSAADFYTALSKSGNEVSYELSREGHSLSTVKYKK